MRGIRKPSKRGTWWIFKWFKIKYDGKRISKVDTSYKSRELGKWHRQYREEKSEAKYFKEEIGAYYLKIPYSEVKKGKPRKLCHLIIIIETGNAHLKASAFRWFCMDLKISGPSWRLISRRDLRDLGIYMSTDSVSYLSLFLSFSGRDRESEHIMFQCKINKL